MGAKIGTTAASPLAYSWCLGITMVGCFVWPAMLWQRYPIEAAVSTRHVDGASGAWLVEASMRRSPQFIIAGAVVLITVMFGVVKGCHVKDRDDVRRLHCASFAVLVLSMAIYFFLPYDFLSEAAPEPALRMSMWQPGNQSAAPAVRVTGRPGRSVASVSYDACSPYLGLGGACPAELAGASHEVLFPDVFSFTMGPSDVRSRGNADSRLVYAACLAAACLGLAGVFYATQRDGDGAHNPFSLHFAFRHARTTDAPDTDLGTQARDGGSGGRDTGFDDAESVSSAARLADSHSLSGSGILETPMDDIREDGLPSPSTSV